MTYEVESPNSPMGCPRCDWLGTRVDVGEEGKCPMCRSGVNPLKQKGLDSLRLHYRHLLKVGYRTDWTIDQRTAEQHRIENFFESIGSPL